MAAKKQSDPKSIINCHTHIFTGDHVPPFLARSILPWPLYYLFPVTLVIAGFRFYYRTIGDWRFMPWYKRLIHLRQQINSFIKRYGIVQMLYLLIGGFLTISVFFVVFDAITAISAAPSGISTKVENFRQFLDNRQLLYIPQSGWGKLLLTFLVFLFFKPGRNLLFFLLEGIWSFLKVIPGKEGNALLQRYINLGRFSFYKTQSRIFGRLQNQYPEGTGFVVLPMDMAYMGAGKPKVPYAQQMEELAGIKAQKKHQNDFFPFVFVEPRRMVEEGKIQFDYEVLDGKVQLKDCFIKTYLETHKFNGIKIYPALGYYPFEEVLLPLWKYAADHQIPILTHCIKGSIYYRGRKLRAWDQHPIFEQSMGRGQYQPLQLPQLANNKYSLNFTHPLNYLCLLEEQLLRRLVAKAKDDRIRELFGFVDADTPMASNLSHLKLCFGHFGGDDQWARFYERDRDNWSSQLIRNPDRGVSFYTVSDNQLSPGKLEQIWRYADWYTIICSMMLQYPNIYGDLSYIIHNPDIEPLLKQTLSNASLRDRVLFGTDFYVVRNHKSEKNMLGDVLSYLSPTSMDQIARNNPSVFLQTDLQEPIA